MSKVYLVGAGPGDPDLITCKGRRLLAQADVVLYDHLANDALLRLTPKHCEQVYVGKKKAAHSHTQQEICGLLVEYGRLGKNVVRLKGGDPFLFGRGGEEVEALVDAGLDFEVVPGVTSPLGIAAYTGVPLTHRDHTSVVTFVTGHDVPHIDWARVGHAETLVVYMGLTQLREIVGQIVAHGRSDATPAMAVRWGTRPDQTTVVGTLANIADRVKAARMKPPATVIIGEVVGLRDRLNWFEQLPLFGQRIVVTRAPEQAGDLSSKLQELGAEVIEVPVIQLVPPLDPEPLDRAIAHLEDYHWVVFTSVNGVRFFLDRLDASNRDLRALRARICAIGSATRGALEALHLKVDFTPPEFVAESLVEAFAPYDLAGTRILLPRAAAARDVIPQALSARGAQVNVVETYRNIIPANTSYDASRKPDWITFTSSSTVKNFLSLAGAQSLEGVRIASIGSATSQTVRQHGLTVTTQADPFTIEGLVRAIAGTNR